MATSGKVKIFWYFLDPPFLLHDLLSTSTNQMSQLKSVSHFLLLPFSSFPPFYQPLSRCILYWFRSSCVPGKCLTCELYSLPLFGIFRFSDNVSSIVQVDVILWFPYLSLSYCWKYKVSSNFYFKMYYFTSQNGLQSVLMEWILCNNSFVSKQPPQKKPLLIVYDLLSSTLSIIS